MPHSKLLAAVLMPGVSLAHSGLLCSASCRLLPRPGSVPLAPAPESEPSSGLVPARPLWVVSPALRFFLQSFLRENGGVWLPPLGLAVPPAAGFARCWSEGRRGLWLPGARAEAHGLTSQKAKELRRSGMHQPPWSPSTRGLNAELLEALPTHHSQRRVLLVELGAAMGKVGLALGCAQAQRDTAP